MSPDAAGLSTQRAVPSRTSPWREPRIDIVPVVATHSRPHDLKGALASVRSQTQTPQRILVVGEEMEDFESFADASPGGSVGGAPEVSRILNRRTRNLAGALNTAIAHLLESGADPDTTYLAFLDDDDRWDPEYLEACLS